MNDSIETSEDEALPYNPALVVSAPAIMLEPLTFQQRVAPWMLECFNEESAADMLERGDRLLEETLGTLQSGGYPEDRVPQLQRYVYSRPVGDPPQEVGGIMVTLAAYCLAAELDMHACGEIVLTRINQPDTILKIRAKQAAKPKLSALPVATPSAPLVAVSYNWQPIETAPYNKRVLVWRDDCGSFVAHLISPFDTDHIEGEDETPVWLSEDFGLQDGAQTPTHWMPLPAAPNIGQVAPQAIVDRRISNDESEPDFWPIAKLMVENGAIASATFYAPGLPDGVHDVFPEPTHLDEHTAAWYGVVQALDAALPGWHDLGGNGIDCAIKAIEKLAEPQATVEPLTDEQIDKLIIQYGHLGLVQYTRAILATPPTSKATEPNCPTCKDTGVTYAGSLGSDGCGVTPEKCGECGYGDESSAPPILKFDPAGGTNEPYPSEAAQYRAWHGPVAWLVNPYTGEARDARDIGSDPTGILIVAPGSNLKSATPSTIKAEPTGEQL